MRWLFRRKVANSASAYKAGKVVLYGANSPVGQKLALLLKLSPHISEVVCCSTAVDELYTVQNNIRHLHRSASSLSSDLQWIDTDAVIQAIPRGAPEQWESSLHDAQVALICPGQNFDLRRSDRDTALECIAPVVQPFVETIASVAPHVVIGVISEPVNALTALCAEWLKAQGAYDPRKLFGLTSLDTARARNLVSEILQMNPYDITLSVIGGRGAGVSLPLLAQSKLRLPLGSAEYITETLMSEYNGQPMKAVDVRSESTEFTCEQTMREYERVWAEEEEKNEQLEQQQQEERSYMEEILKPSASLKEKKEKLLQNTEYNRKNNDDSEVMNSNACKRDCQVVSSSMPPENQKHYNSSSSNNSYHVTDKETKNAMHELRERSKQFNIKAKNVQRESTNDNDHKSSYNSNSSDDEEEIIPCPANTCASDMAISCASYDFVISVLKAMRGDLGICECALTELPLYDSTPFFAAKVLLGRDGVERVIMHNDLSQYEKTVLHEAVLPELAADVQAGANFYTKSTCR